MKHVVLSKNEDHKQAKDAFVEFPFCFVELELSPRQITQKSYQVQ